MENINENIVSMQFEKLQDLKYGENPHQTAALYRYGKMIDFDLIKGEKLTYNNILDINTAVGVVSEFYDVAACAIVKHGMPCGAALGKKIDEAYLKALDSDPVSALNGTAAFSQTITETMARQIVQMHHKLAAAPDFTDEAMQILKKDENLKIIKLNTPLRLFKALSNEEIRITPFGTIIQEPDSKELDKDSFKVVTKKKPDADMVENMVFAWKVAKYVKSNAIVIAKDFKTVAICGGQTSRIDSVEIALDKACDNAKDAVIASDGFFPAADNIQFAAQNRIAGLIQPGGSIKDKEVIETADKYDMVMITTGIRHFRH